MVVEAGADIIDPRFLFMLHDILTYQESLIIGNGRIGYTTSGVHLKCS